MAKKLSWQLGCDTQTDDGYDTTSTPLLYAAVTTTVWYETVVSTNVFSAVLHVAVM